jgi:hypothetical protein
MLESEPCVVPLSATNAVCALLCIAKSRGHKTSFLSLRDISLSSHANWNIAFLKAHESVRNVR